MENRERKQQGQINFCSIAVKFSRSSHTNIRRQDCLDTFALSFRSFFVAGHVC